MKPGIAKNAVKERHFLHRAARLLPTTSNSEGAVFAMKYVVLIAASLLLPAGAQSSWILPGAGGKLAATQDYPNVLGSLRLQVQGGPVDMASNPFFAPLGANGRACVTCHQPINAMSVSALSARQRWQQYGDSDALFAAYDGSNCPDLPQDKAESHSLLLSKGLIRIARSWPPRDLQGHVITPDFRIEVVRDPTGCNTSKIYGLNSPNPQISVFRRPRMVANFKYVVATGFNDDPKDGLPLPTDPLSGKLASRNLMADARVLTLKEQMRDAAVTHLQRTKPLTAEQESQIEDLEMRLFTAQQSGPGGDEQSGGASGGTDALANGLAGRLGDQTRPVWSEYAAWAKAADNPALTPVQRAFRLSVARGAKIFRDRTFLITDSAGINYPIGFGNPVRNSCVFCHNMSQMGMDVAPGQVDLGTTTLPFADPQPDLPLFKITCLGQPHPFYGKVIYTHDPGYALTTGRCVDVGKITLQSLRGLAARAPYFSNGMAKDLRAVVDYYNRRYNIGYTEQEKQDLVNLLSVL